MSISQNLIMKLTGIMGGEFWIYLLNYDWRINKKKRHQKNDGQSGCVLFSKVETKENRHCIAYQTKAFNLF